jgi:hypothetical protein
MKKFLLGLVVLLPFISFGQNGANEVLTAPNTTTPYILVDTLFTLDNYPATYTDVYIHFANPTVDDIKAVQFRLFYDNIKFSSATMFWGPTAQSVADKYGSYFNTSDYINVIATYTGNSPNFNWANGAMFKLRLTHSSAYDGIASSVAITGTTSYNNLATTGNGVDEPLNLFSYGGAFQMTPLEFPVKVRNADGTPTQGVWFSASKRLKSTPQASWQPISTDSTNAVGLLSFTHPIDTNYWNLKINAQTDSMSDGGALSIVDAYKLANHASQQDTLSGIEWYEGDINQDGNASISDAFAMFNRLALGSTTWNSLFSGINNVSVLWENEWSNANSAVAAPNWTNSPRRYVIDTIVNSLDSLEPYIYVVGDATTSGYNNPATILAKMANPSSGTQYILDPAVYLSNREDTVQFYIPKLIVTQDFKMEVPITLYTFGNELGALQMGIEYDTNIFRFNSIRMGDAASKWTSLISVKDESVFWAGHEDKMNPSIITDMTTQFTFVFDVVSPLGWTTSPLRIFNKAAGDENAYDVNIKPSPNDGSVVNKNEMDPSVYELVQSFRVFPNPVSEVTGNWLLIEHINDYKNSKFDGVIYDINGRIIKGFSEKIYDRGYQYHGIDMNDVPPGFYIVKLVTLDREKFFKIVKY